VSEESRKLKSSGTNGSGTPHQGRIAIRRTSADSPTIKTANILLRANRPKNLSALLNNRDPRSGHANEDANKIAARLPSIIVSVRVCCCGRAYINSIDIIDYQNEKWALTIRVRPIILAQFPLVSIHRDCEARRCLGDGELQLPCGTALPRESNCGKNHMRERRIRTPQATHQSSMATWIATIRWGSQKTSSPIR
jgi:hypothetical protein